MPQQSSRWSVKGSSLRFKISLAVTIPMAVAAILGALQVRADLSQAIQYRDNADQVTVLGPAVDYLRAAEQATVAAHQDSPAAQRRLTEAVTDLNAAADDLAARAARAQLSTEQVRQLVAVLDLSRAMREEGAELSAETWVAQLRQLQSGVSQLLGTIADSQVTPEPRLELLSQVLTGRFSLAMQQSLAAGGTGSTQVERWSELGVESAAIDRLASALGDSEPSVLTLRTDNSERFRSARTGRAGTAGAKAFKPYDTLMTSLQQGIDEHLSQAADERQASAVRNAITTLVVFLAAMLLALLVSHLLLDPIRRVREGARDVAREKLPQAVARIRSGQEPEAFEPIDVRTTEEMGQLARAVDDLHRQAITLASSEAEARAQVDEMFVTLSRRSTSLVNQQLALIESLEKDEEDPRRLDSLFRLDHLASRMRRTADSLLILGNAPSRPGDQADLSLTETLQAATSGVLDYQRVRIDTTATEHLSPGSVADVVHLLTELVDNALAYSPPTAQVEVSAHTRSAGVDVEVVDSGLGIAPAELISLNQTLTADEDVTGDTARRMGLFVVSRLASRHGISVHLSHNRSGGTTARVHLPAALLVAAREPVADRLPVTAAAPVPPEEPRAPEPTPEPTPQPTAASIAESDPSPIRIEEPVAPAAASQLAPAGAGLPQRRPGSSAALPGLPDETSRDVSRPPTSSTPVSSRPAVESERVAIAEMSSLRRRVRHVEATTPHSATLDRSQAVIGSPRPRDVEVAVHPQEETPMFRNLRSSWFGGAGEESWRASEVEHGWERAGEVAQSAPEPAGLTEAGLPVRRPGARLVPGSVTQEPTAPAVDPEQVRARLSAHAAGVSRGRRVAAATPETSEPTAPPLTPLHDLHPGQEAGDHA